MFPKVHKRYHLDKTSITNAKKLTAINHDQCRFVKFLAARFAPVLVSMITFTFTFHLDVCITLMMDKINIYISTIALWTHHLIHNFPTYIFTYNNATFLFSSFLKF